MATDGGGSGGPSLPPAMFVPRDEADHRFTQSFDAASTSPEEDVAAKGFFEEFGFVVFRNVLTKDEAKATRDEMFRHLETEVDGFRRDDKDTWAEWKGRTFGMPAGKDPMFSPAVLNNRQNPRLLKSHAVLYGHDDLLVNHDRWAIYRPTKDVEFPSGTRDCPEWKTRPSLHFDFNPTLYLSDEGDAVKKQLETLAFSSSAELYAENNAVTRGMGLQTQCVINLATNVEEDGGFICVPGFHKVAESYLARVPAQDSKSRSYMIDKSDPVWSFAQRITMRAGSIVVWNQLLAHGSRPNNSSHFRAAMFCRMFSCRPEDAPGASTRFPARAACVHRAVTAAGVDVTDTGEKVFGFHHLPSHHRRARK